MKTRRRLKVKSGFKKKMQDLERRLKLKLEEFLKRNPHLMGKVEEETEDWRCFYQHPSRWAHVNFWYIYDSEKHRHRHHALDETVGLDPQKHPREYELARKETNLTRLSRKELKALADLMMFFDESDLEMEYVGVTAGEVRYRFTYKE